ncbi:ABC transporter ATP-binding protein [Pseudoflavitalea sp. X16]|uniref:ATP-binding cassette domain-containing protein n=1 Tax=Paraflavitalea devenefica TaxID=2716334 RepID=UPI001423C8AD|nr:ATP-binding cassette domain-containing protein [Paraflavitalea devenefica]NII24875.1 ABC transporter ATP-binding protein [Paraflavitalea devenefica]
MAIPYEQKDTILHVENLCVAYGDKVILRDVNLLERDTIREGKSQGQVIAVLGRSGRGKSTLFRALTGLENPTSGRVLIPDYSKPASNGKQPAKLVQEGDVGFVNQKYTLFRHKTVYEALWFALRKSGMTKAEKEEEIMHYLREWGLEKNKDQYPNFLSGGQRQRTAILEQLLSSGYYMVLDEPFSGLDIGNIMSVKKAFELISLRHDLNTIIFSTHDIELAVELADSIYIIGYPQDEQGNAIHTGTVLKHFDLKQMGLAWHDGLAAPHFECVQMIKEIMLRS